MPYKDPERQREYQLNWMLYRRNEWINKNGPCVKCRLWVDLEVDHVDPSTKVDHKVWSWSSDRRNEELEKCQVLCRLCHSEKTISENSNHGLSKYNRKGCRCIVCKKAKSIVNKRRKRRSGEEATR